MIASTAAAIEIRDPVHGAIPIGRGELAVIDSATFQRLRGIKQLGFGELVFPGAVHNRYLHSIGAMHVAGQVLERALAVSSEVGGALTAPERARLVQVGRLAALTHDVGHPPLSHAAEALLPTRREVLGEACLDPEGRASHEDMTYALLLRGELAGLIGSAFGDLGITAADVAAVIASESPDRDVLKAQGLDFGPLLHAVVSGELDVDRMDYLLRDSYFTGVDYGTYDRAWLVSNVRPVVEEGRVHVGLDMRALPAFEHFLLARYHMFQMVYYHPISDSYDATLKRWLAAEGGAARLPADLETYARCHDGWLWQRLEASKSPIARQIVDKRPPRLVVELRTDKDRAARASLSAAFEEAGLAVTWRTSRPVLSRLAMDGTPHPLRVVETRPMAGPPRVLPVTEVTDLFERYQRALRVERAYAEPADRDAVRAIVRAQPSP